jgi:hypothetical protein
VGTGLCPVQAEQSSAAAYAHSTLDLPHPPRAARAAHRELFANRFSRIRNFRKNFLHFADSSTQMPLAAFILIGRFANLIVPLACAHEIPEKLEVPDPAVFCRRRAGLHHRECR